METVAGEIHGGEPSRPLFADDIVLTSGTRSKVEGRLRAWITALENQGLKVNKTKTEYMECIHQAEGTVNIGGADEVKAENIKWLVSVLN